MQDSARNLALARVLLSFRMASRCRQQSFRYDALSITQQSFWLDLKRIALSCWITCRGTWEYRGRKF
ncbi:MAG: hypothetical protein ACREOH_12365 [Candidatus Entotheonellia bacterium]